MPESDQEAIARALWIVGAGRCEMRSEPLPATGLEEVALEAFFGAVSRGTERLVFEGRVPADEYERMRAPHQGGSFPFPVKYGYALVGRVARGSARLAGRTVFCLHPHQDRAVLSADALVPVPEGVPPERAVLAANMETALNVVWDSGLSAGDRVNVVGGGLVGLLVASLAARVAGVAACLVDIDATRGSVAAALGIGFATPNDAPDECDVVIHCSGDPAGLAGAIAMGGTEARIVEASWYGEGKIPVPLGGAFHSRRLSIVASQVGSVPPWRRARWSNRRRLETALALLADDRLDLLFSGETRFADLAGAYAGILTAPETLCHRIRYD